MVAMSVADNRIDSGPRHGRLPDREVVVGMLHFAVRACELEFQPEAA
jgi:hypothetical protein